ncbi:Soluble aldose sugar dehydrogenase YliI precursor [Pirellulimonas nuda]|uniref:Soluble aldose sugar dehydrogenase YliI n=1 Tax=Pirellulimonas nuda TaxID=2528009 RepID=A0A518DF78_9BACT|nr:PQQ-dependent sugar dehydrogenase [Pirellulimonas nuda]QDU90116.1 Soluble aldose sugar dehydrogenase YliI precursor [Pirellulimonas nuda]
MRPCRLFCLFIALLATVCASARAEISGASLVATANNPVFVTHAPGDKHHLFVVERGAQQGAPNNDVIADIRVLDLRTGAFAPQPFLSVNLPNTSGERGLLSMAFHPDYQANGKFYIYASREAYSGGNHASYVEQYSVTTDPMIADPASRSVVARFTQPQSNHNGGWIGFSPNDNYLYIASGDGGNSNDTGTGHTGAIGNAQDITGNLLGKMLRVDPLGDDFPADANRNYAVPASNPFVGVTGDDEIWAYGLRNPWRNSFDRETGDLLIGDVGQDNREEVNFQAAGSPGGENYGWRLREGTIATPTGGVGGAKPTDAVDPIHDYAHNGGSRSIYGGYVYRGPDPEVDGWYFFGDTVTRDVWRFRPDSPAATLERINDTLFPGGNNDFRVSMGEDAVGNLYVVSTGGSIYRIETDATAPGDFTGDGLVNVEDYTLWRSDFGVSASTADGNRDGLVDAADYSVWRDNADVSDPIEGAAVPEPSGWIILTGFISLSLAVGFMRWHFDRSRAQTS